MQTGERPRAAAGDRQRGIARAVRGAGARRAESAGHPTAQRRSPPPRDDQDPGDAPSLDALGAEFGGPSGVGLQGRDRKSTRLNSSHLVISYAVFCLKKKKKKTD